MNETDKIRAEAYASHIVPCRYCGAKATQPCTNKITGKELAHFGAHQRRITDAKTPPAEIDDDDEVPF